MASAPIFTGTPRHEMVQISTANTNRDGTGTLGTLLTAGSSGSRIEHIQIMGVGTVTAGVVRIFIDDGTNKRLWREISVTATTPSGTVVGFSTTVDCSYLAVVLIL